MIKYYNDDEFTTETIKKRKSCKFKAFANENNSIGRSTNNGKRQRKNWIKDFESGILGEEEF